MRCDECTGKKIFDEHMKSTKGSRHHRKASNKDKVSKLCTSELAGPPTSLPGIKTIIRILEESKVCTHVEEEINFLKRIMCTIYSILCEEYHTIVEERE